MARSGWETRLRMVWMLDAGLPRPLCNPPVFDLYGGLPGISDLLELVHEVLDRSRRDRVQGRARLLHQQHLRLDRDRTRDAPSAGALAVKAGTPPA